MQGLSGTITSATLRIYANSASSTGYNLHAVTDNTWTETGITYSCAPAMGTQLGSSGAITANTWTTVDVTAYITGDGTYNFAFSTTSSTNITLRLRGAEAPLRSGQGSREGANTPQLIVETAPRKAPVNYTLPRWQADLPELHAFPNGKQATRPVACFWKL